MSSKRATLELVDVENAPPQEDIAFTTVLQQTARVFTNQYVNSSNLNLALETLNSTRIVKCVKPAKDRNHHCKTASGETGRWWRQMDGHWSMTWSKTAPKGIKRALSHHNDDDKISQIDRTQLTIKQRRWLTDNLNMWTRTALMNSRNVSGLGLRLTWMNMTLYYGYRQQQAKANYGWKQPSSRQIAVNTIKR